MRRLLVPVLACLLSCDTTLPLASNPPADASPVASAPIDNTITLPPIDIIARKQPRRVLITGDSEACRVGFYAKKVIAQINAENHEPADVVDVDCKGGTVVQYWGTGGNLKLALARHPHPDDVLVFLGTNHYWQRVTPPTSTVTDLLRDTNCIWVGNTAVHGKHWAINGLIRDAVTPQCAYFDTEAADIPLDDGVHPGHAGAVKWLRMVWATIPTKYEEDQ